MKRILRTTAMISHNAAPLASQSIPTWASPAAEAGATASTNTHSMVVSVLLGFVLMCAGMGVVYFIYMFLLWFFGSDNSSSNNNDQLAGVKVVASKGLSKSELEELPRVKGKELVMGNDCAVCLDEIESEEEARIVPGCNHGFHIQCGDTWLSKRAVCPICRASVFSIPPV
ncbi:hypothetical protein ACFE04_012648 [Oxalis oulophora]